MTIDYKALADDIAANNDNDPVAAHARISAETMPPTQPYRMLMPSDIRRWLLRTPAAQARAQQIATAAAGNDIQAMLAHDMLFGDDGLDLNVPEVLRAATEILDDVSGTTVLSDSLKAAAANPPVPKRPNLKVGQVKNAIEWRAEGLI